MQVLKIKIREKNFRISLKNASELELIFNLLLMISDFNVDCLLIHVLI